MARELNKVELNRLARLGAAARLEELERERRAILRAFPGLAFKSQEPAAEPAKKPRKKRRKMSAAEKKAASERMKKYWAARKQQG